jgi:(p)ppGpp synthase/HD superfamily hydrolase
MTNEELLIKAKEVARAAHTNQFRFDKKTPYIKHVEGVVNRVHSVEEKIVAALHDTIEDSDVTEQSLLDMGFDKKIVDAVVLLTKTEGYDYINYMRSIKLNPLAKAVKIADMRANLADTPTKNQIKRYSDGILYLLT